LHWHRPRRRPVGLPQYDVSVRRFVVTRKAACFLRRDEIDARPNLGKAGKAGEPVPLGWQLRQLFSALGRAVCAPELLALRAGLRVIEIVPDLRSGVEVASCHTVAANRVASV